MYQRLFTRILYISIGGFSLLSLLNPVKVNAEISPLPTQLLNPYSEGILKVLLDACYSKSSLVYLPIPTNRTLGKSAQKLADEVFDPVLRSSQQQEEQINSQVQQRMLQLREQIKDKKKLKAELQQINLVISSGSINGKSIEPSSLEALKKSQKDLQKLQDNPNYLNVMAQEASKAEVSKVRENVMNLKQGLNSCVCVTTVLQKQHTEQELLKRMLEELQSGPSFSKDWRMASETCKAPNVR